MGPEPSAFFHACEKTAPPNPGIKQLRLTRLPLRAGDIQVKPILILAATQTKIRIIDHDGGGSLETRAAHQWMTAVADRRLCVSRG